MRYSLLCFLIIAAPVRAQRSPQTTDELFKVGIEYRIKGRHEEAARIFTEIIEFDPDVPKVFAARGMANVRRMLAEGRFVNSKQAEEDLSEAIRRDEPNPLIYAARGFVRAVLGRQDGRDDLYKSASFKGPMPPLAFAGMGRYAVADGDYGHAAWLYRKAYENSLPSSRNSPMRGWIIKEMYKVREKARQKFTQGKNAIVRPRRDVIHAPGGEALIPQRVIDEDVRRDRLQLLAEGNLEERKAAAAALGTPGNDDAVPLLIDALKLESSELKVQAISSLGKIGSAKAVPPILRHIDHKNYRIRLTSVRALGEIGSERARMPLESRRKIEKDDRIRLEIGRSLKEIAEAIFNLKLDMDMLLEDILKEQKRKDKE